MDGAAIVCPNCLRERMDFYKLKVMTYSFLAFATGALFFGLVAGSWEFVLLGGFDGGKFFSSVSGWVLVIAVLISVYTYVKASRIIGTWWWY